MAGIDRELLIQLATKIPNCCKLCFINLKLWSITILWSTVFWGGFTCRGGSIDERKPVDREEAVREGPACVFANEERELYSFVL